MQILEYISLFRKYDLPYATYGISSSSPKTWTIIRNFRNFFPLSKNVDYHMQFLAFLSLLQKPGLSYAIFEISFSSPNRGLSYAIFRISFPLPKTWTIIC